jgi:putative FmdB family regulatory protein
MPFYEYACGACKEEYEVFYKTQSAVKEEEPLEKCPKCGSKKKKKLVSKGTGFVLNSITILFISIARPFRGEASTYWFIRTRIRHNHESLLEA